MPMEKMQATERIAARKDLGEAEMEAARAAGCESNVIAFSCRLDSPKTLVAS
jgi:hypothetical protein